MQNPVTRALSSTNACLDIDPRGQEMSARYLTGETLESIGVDFGLTRERVRQIVRDHGHVSAADARAARQAQVEAQREALRRRAATAVRQRPGLSLRQLAELLGVSHGELSAALDRATRAMLVREQHSHQRWSDEDILSCLRQAAALYPGKPLTGHRYDRVKTAVGGPTRVRILQRFATWLAACEAAGVRGGTSPRRRYQRGWTESELLGWVADYLAQPSMSGTYAGYDAWARRTAGAPSAQTVRNRLGAWAAVKRAAAVLVVAREQARPDWPNVSLAA